jgi:hypothetical protein
VVRLADAYYDHLYRAISRRGRAHPSPEWVNETEPPGRRWRRRWPPPPALEVRDLADARRRAAEQTSSAFNLIFGRHRPGGGDRH